MPAPLAGMLQVTRPTVSSPATYTLPAARVFPPSIDGSISNSLQLFDERWIMYLEQFVCWKSADAGAPCLHCACIAELCSVKTAWRFCLGFHSDQLRFTASRHGPFIHAAGLEAELVRVAVELETSRLAKVASGASPSARLRSPEDIQAS